MGPYVSGIDEAGRGSVFGPLIIVGVTLVEEVVKQLSRLGLKDSKLFNGVRQEEERTKLSEIIKKKAFELKIVEIPAIDIDRTLANRPADNLNLLELRHFTDIIEILNSPKIAIDNISSPQYSHKTIVYNLQEKIPGLKTKILFSDQNRVHFSVKIYNKQKNIEISKAADRNYPIVSAASCVAKTIRDNRLREIEKAWNLPNMQLGRGYPHVSDRNIKEFLEKYYKEIHNRSFPFIRYNWKWPPLQKILEQKLPKLDDYLK